MRWLREYFVRTFDISLSVQYTVSTHIGNFTFRNSQPHFGGNDISSGKSAVLCSISKLIRSLMYCQSIYKSVRCFASAQYFVLNMRTLQFLTIIVTIIAAASFTALVDGI